MTCKVINLQTQLIPCKIETKFPSVKWDLVWSYTVTKGLPSDLRSFLWRMVHDLLPTPSRMFRLKLPNISSENCQLCTESTCGDLAHCLLSCPFNDGVEAIIYRALSKHNKILSKNEIVHLDFEVGNQELPVMFLVGTVFLYVWTCRKEKKVCRMQQIRATLEAKVNILRKGRFNAAADTLLEYLKP